MTSNHKILYAFAHALTLCGLAPWFWLIYALSCDQLTESSLMIVTVVSLAGFGMGFLLYNRIWKQVR